MPTALLRRADSGSPGRALLHRFNNFLTLCTTHAEVALDSRRPEELAQALQGILDGAHAASEELRALGRTADEGGTR